MLASRCGRTTPCVVPQDHFVKSAMSFLADPAINNNYDKKIIIKNN